MSAKPILRYALVHSLELALVVTAVLLLRHFTKIPLWLVIVIPVLWMLKDLALFTRVWRAYIPADPDPMTKFIGLEATAVGDLDPAGYVRVRGELWKAEISDPRCPARKGDKTRVIDIKGKTLIVETCSSPELSSL